jgi:hypothetical protein
MSRPTTRRAQLVGWAKRPDANAFGGVPTIRREDIRFKKWWARRRCAFARPTDSHTLAPGCRCAHPGYACSVRLGGPSGGRVR